MVLTSKQAWEQYSATDMPFERLAGRATGNYTITSRQSKEDLVSASYI